MNYKTYERFGSVHVFLFIGGCILLFLIISVTAISKIKVYTSITGVVSGPNQVMVMVSSQDLSWLYHNNDINFNGYKTSFCIDRVNRDMMSANGKKYHQVFLTLSIPKKYRENEVIALALYQKNDSFIKTFFKIWKGV